MSELQNLIMPKQQYEKVTLRMAIGLILNNQTTEYEVIINGDVGYSYIEAVFFERGLSIWQAICRIANDFGLNASVDDENKIIVLVK